MVNIFKFKFFIILVSFCFSLKGAFATSLAEVLEEALNSSVQISAGKNNLESQLEGINRLMAQKKPALSANFSGSSEWDLKNDEESSSFSAGFTARYLLFDGNVTNYQISAESFRIKALESEFEGIKQKVIYDAIIAYLNVLRDDKLVQLSSKNVLVLKEQLDATMSRYELGELTQTDVAQAQSALEAATSSLASRKGALYLANTIFETAVGIKPIGLDTTISLPDMPKNEIEAKESAIKFNMNLRASQMRQRRANALLDAANSNRSPTLNISTSLTGGETALQQDFSNFGISLTGSIPIYSGGSLESGRRKAQSDLELSMVNEEITRLTVQQAVITAWSDYSVSSAVITARTREVEAAELAYKGTLEETRLGARTILDVLNAEQSLMNAQTNLETAKRDRLAGGYRLLFEMGKLAPSILGLERLIN